MGREEFEMPMHKVGIKLLADKQIRNVLPSYENLLDRIKKHREEIGKLNGEKFRHYQYNMMYDNVFSVYGKRGTGKTSVAFSLTISNSHPSALQSAGITSGIIIGITTS